MSSSTFEGKVAVVTGAASGFGRGIAEHFAREGACVVLVDRNAEGLEETYTTCKKTGFCEPLSLHKDLRHVSTSRQIIDATLEHTRGRIDILVNSAGVSYFAAINTITQEEWDEVFEIDVRPLYFLSVAAAEVMDPSRGGRIINIGSNAGRKGRAMAAHYAAAKAAVANLTESLALAYGKKNITVNTVCPAAVITKLWDTNFRGLLPITGKTREEHIETWARMTPLGRLGTVEDIVDLVSFLASNKAGFITAQAINICGGFMLTC
jgi:meso-butanediol dehydrogenase / (S,S)-butanediol dehydrogenase / diacetyl reductase